jgi:hypothetical protein
MIAEPHIEKTDVCDGGYIESKPKYAVAFRGIHKEADANK